MVAAFYAEHVDITLSRGVKGEPTQSYAEPSASSDTASQNDSQQGASVSDPIYSSASLLPNIPGVSMLSQDSDSSSANTIETSIGVFKDFTDPRSHSPMCGLYNLGNTCFMNAGLQCILSAESFVDFLLEQNLTDFKDFKNGKHGCSLSKSLSNLVYNMTSGQYSYVYPRDFYKELSTHFPHLGDFKQHDAQEHLVFLLDRMRDEMNPLQGSSSGSDTHLPDESCMLEDECFNGKKRTRLDVVESAAAKAWRQYLDDNPSQIVKLFQGQYSSKVQCTVCSHSSTTYEPFTILSLPLPHRARLKYISVSWITCPSAVPINFSSFVVRYIVDVVKNATIGDLKKRCLEMMVNDQPLPSQLMVAEVVKGSVRRFLDDHIPVQSLEITKGEVYVFEVPTVPPAAVPSEDDMSQEGMDTYSDLEHSKDKPTEQTFSKPSVDLLNEDLLSIEELQLLTCNQNDASSRGNVQEDSSTGPADISTWHSCQICLEEMVDCDLLVHSSCGGTLCRACKNQLSAFHKDGPPQCPVCIQSVNLSVDFVPMVKQSERPNVVKNIPVPVLFRFQNLTDDAKFTISQHPVILILPTQVKTHSIYHLISEFLSVITPSVTEHEVFLSGSQGLYCSRCDFSRKCSGCVVSREGVLELKPGDHLAVTLMDNSLHSKLNEVVEHQSVKDKKELTVSLEDCFACFHEKEELGKENPWYCSHCSRNQIAVRTMSISHYPDTLIIHLKRFYYEGHSSDKIDAGVKFSDVFDLSMFGMDKEQVSSDPCLVYSLQSIVCHKGTMNSGHYTAYVKNSKKSTDSEWYLLNDEHVFKESPVTKENQFVYILLYQRQGSS